MPHNRLANGAPPSDAPRSDAYDRDQPARGVTDAQSKCALDAPVRPASQAPRGCLRFDRCFAGIGVNRLQRSSGTKDQVKFDSLDAILTTCAASEETAIIVRMFAYGALGLDQLALAGSDAGRKLLISTCKQLESAAAKRDAIPRESVSATSTSQVAQLGDPAPPGALETTDVLTLILGPRASDAEQVARPLWDTARTLIQKMTIKAASARRYQTSLDSFERKCATLAIPEAKRDILAGISPMEWAAFETLASRHISVTEMRALISMSTAQQAQRLRDSRIRISTDYLTRLSKLTWVELDTLAKVGLRGASVDVLDSLDTVKTSEERQDLSALGSLLGPECTIADLVRVTSKQWSLLSEVWGTSNADWNHLRRALSAVLTQLFHSDSAHKIRRYIIDNIPLKPETQEVPDVSPDTFWRIMSYLSEYARDFPLVLVLTGLRIGEYEALEPEHLRHETHTIHVPGTKTDGSLATIAVDPEMWHYVVAAVPSPFRYAHMRTLFREACDKAGVKGLTLHGLRHCHGQWAMENGALEHEVQAQLRHMSVTTTRRYTQTLNKKKSAVAASEYVMNARPS